jgi:AhpC/TSA family protein
VREWLLTRVRIVVATAGALAGGFVRAMINRGAQPAVRLQPGDAAPPFELSGSDGRTYRLRDLRGHTVVLAWFPKAFTGG